MRDLVAALAIVLAASSVEGGVLQTDELASRPLDIPPFVVSGVLPLDFDLIDLRATPEPPSPALDKELHSIFVTKKHLGISAGYDNQILHGSVGLYVTVAEWGRWNFGIPSVGFGFGRYHVYDMRSRQATEKSEPTLIFSLASLHYRVGYLQSYGVNAYLNFEQVFDVRTNLMGSQFGISFSRK